MTFEETKDFSRPGRSVTGRELHPENGHSYPSAQISPDPLQDGLERISEGTEARIVMSGHGLYSL